MMIILSSMMDFCANYLYGVFEESLSIPGVALFCCAVSGIGFIVMYKVLPETDNRTLEEIEMHFTDDSKGINEHKIAKILHKPPEVI